MSKGSGPSILPWLGRTIILMTVRYLVLKNMGEAEYVADYILGNGNKEDTHLIKTKGLCNGDSCKGIRMT